MTKSLMLHRLLIVAGVCLAAPMVACLSVPDGDADGSTGAATGTATASTDSNPSMSETTAPTGADGSSGSPTTSTAGPTTGSAESTSGDGTGSSGSTGASLAVCPTFADDFEDGVIDPRWVPTYPGSITEAAGELTYDVTPAAGDEFARVMLTPEVGMAGATARMQVATPPATLGVQLILWVQAPNNNELLFTLDDAQLHAEYRVDGTLTSVQSTAFDAAAHAWLQIREEAGTVYWEVSGDGATYSPFASVATPIALDLADVGAVGHNYAPIPEVEQVSIGAFELDCG